MEGTAQPGKEAASPGGEGAAAATGRLPSCPQESSFRYEYSPPITHRIRPQLPHQRTSSRSDYPPFAKETLHERRRWLQS